MLWRKGVVMVADMAGIMEEARWGVPVERRQVDMVERRVKAKADRMQLTGLNGLKRGETPV
jgi:hypothetical protein